jgi:hypothetical protein
MGHASKIWTVYVAGLLIIIAGVVAQDAALILLAVLVWAIGFLVIAHVTTARK